MVQKFLLANALALNPALVLLDEPTGALDIASSRGITALIQELNRRLGTAFWSSPHDMKLAADLGGGRWCSTTGTWRRRGHPRPFDHPATPTRGLLQSAVGLNPVRDMWGIRPTTVSTRQPTAAPFTAAVPRACPPAPATPRADGAARRPPGLQPGGVLTLLECRGLCKAFRAAGAGQHRPHPLQRDRLPGGPLRRGQDHPGPHPSGLLPWRAAARWSSRGGGRLCRPPPPSGQGADGAPGQPGRPQPPHDGAGGGGGAQPTVRLFQDRGGGQGAGGRGPFSPATAFSPAHPRPVRRPAAAGGHCPRSDHGAGPSHCRRAHLHAGPLPGKANLPDAQGPAEQPGASPCCSSPTIWTAP